MTLLQSLSLSFSVAGYHNVLIFFKNIRDYTINWQVIKISVYDNVSEFHAHKHIAVVQNFVDVFYVLRNILHAIHRAIWH